MKKRRVRMVLAGGGSGIKTIAEMLRDDPTMDLTLIHSTFDNGGHSGRLRERGCGTSGDIRYGALGDIRKGIEALADQRILKKTELGRIFRHRTKKVGNSLMDGVSGGNMLLAMSLEIRNMDWSHIPEVTRLWSRTLGVRGRVLPVSLGIANILGCSRGYGPVHGQKSVDASSVNSPPIMSVSLSPKVPIYAETATAIREADVIVFCPGSFWGSVIINTLVEGFTEAVDDGMRRGARIAILVNLTRSLKDGDFHTSDVFVRELAAYLFVEEKQKIDAAFCNTGELPKSVLKRLAEKGETLVRFVPSDQVRENVTGPFAILTKGYKVQHNHVVAGALVDWAKQS